MSYAADGSLNVTIVDGTTFTGLYAADGSINVIEAPGGSHTGAYHPCGALYVEITETPVESSYAPTGALYISTSVQGVARVVTIVAGGFPDWALADAALDLDFQRDRYYTGGVNEAFGDVFTFTRNSIGTAENLDGSWTTFAANEPRITDKGWLIEEARTNGIRNNTMQGAVAGTPGTLPTNWDVPSWGLPSGVSRQVIGVGTDLGMNYVDIRFHGTAGETNYPGIYFDNTSTIVAANGQVWTGSVYFKLMAGGAPSFSLFVAEADSGGNALAQSNGTGLVPSSEYQRLTHTRTFNNAGTARTGSWIAYTHDNGATWDFTIRIAWPQLEQGSFATSPIPTSGSAVNRAVDLCNLGSTDSAIFTASEATVFSDFTRSGADTSGSLGRVWDGSSHVVWTATASTGFLAGFLNNGDTLPNFNSYTRGQDALFALAWDGTNARAALNGTQDNLETTTAPATSNLVFIGNRADNQRPLNGYIRRITAWDSRLADATVEALTELPSAFSFTDVTDAEVETLYESNIITVAGLYDNVEVPMRITGGEYSLNGGAYATAPVLVKNGDTVQVKVTSSQDAATAVNVVLTIGNATDTYTVTTATAYDVSADALFTRVASAGGSWDNTKKGHVNTLISTLKADGIWAKLDALNIWTESVSAVAILDWKTSGNIVNSQVGCSFSATNGLTTDGVIGSGIQLSYNPTNDGLAFLQNSASMGMWLKTAANTTGPGIGGGTAWANIEDASNRIGFRFNDGTTSVSATNSNTDGTGFFVLTRPDASNKYSYKNGNTTPVGSHAVASTALANSAMHVGTNALSTAPYTSQILMSFFGGGLTATDQQNFYNALNTYFTAIGAL